MKRRSLFLVLGASVVTLVLLTGCPSWFGETTTQDPVLTVSLNSVVLEVDGSSTIVVTSKDRYGETESFVAQPVNPAIAVVVDSTPSSFRIVGRQIGSTTIQVTSLDSGLTRTIAVEVRPFAGGEPSVTALPNPVGLTVGGSEVLTINAYTSNGGPDTISSVVSRNTGVATVNRSSALGQSPQSVTVTAVGEGSTVIDILSGSGAATTVNVTVTTSGGVQTGIAIQSHGENAILTGTVTVSGSVLGTPDGVDVTLGGMSWTATVNNGQWSVSVDTTTVDDGEKNLQAFANYGIESAVDTRTVTVDNGQAVTGNTLSGVIDTSQLDSQVRGAIVIGLFDTTPIESTSTAIDFIELFYDPNKTDYPFEFTNLQDGSYGIGAFLDRSDDSLVVTRSPDGEYQTDEPGSGWPMDPDTGDLGLQTISNDYTIPDPLVLGYPYPAGPNAILITIDLANVWDFPPPDNGQDLHVALFDQSNTDGGPLWEKMYTYHGDQTQTLGTVFTVAEGDYYVGFYIDDNMNGIPEPENGEVVHEGFYDMPLDIIGSDVELTLNALDGDGLVPVELR